MSKRSGHILAKHIAMHAQT